MSQLKRRFTFGRSAIFASILFVFAALTVLPGCSTTEPKDCHGDEECYGN